MVRAKFSLFWLPVRSRNGILVKRRRQQLHAIKSGQAIASIYTYCIA
ncbi:hypothetical protein [Nostoc sp.]